MEMQSTCILRQFELRQRDMALAKLAQHRGLCHDIIVSQRQLLEDNQVPPPRELDELYEMWQQDTHQLLLEQQVRTPATPLSSGANAALTSVITHVAVKLYNVKNWHATIY